MDNPVLTQWLTEPDGLASRLDRGRRRAGLTGVALAEALGWTEAKVSRVRNGKVLPTPEDVEAWGRTVQMDDDEVAELTALLVVAQQRHVPWRQRVAQGQHSNQAAYTELVRRSSEITLAEVGPVPGPLQTPAYARAALLLFGAMRPELPLDDLDQAVAARVERSDLVFDKRGGRRWRFIIHESVLSLTPTTAVEMVEQLDLLVRAARLDWVDLHILPVRAESKALMVANFGLYRVAGDEMVLVETLQGETEHVDTESIETYHMGIEWLVDASASGEDAIALVDAAATDFRSRL